MEGGRERRASNGNGCKLVGYFPPLAPLVPTSATHDMCHATAWGLLTETRGPLKNQHASSAYGNYRDKRVFFKIYI